MTNLEKLLRSNAEILNYVTECISEKYCFDTETIEVKENMWDCENCPFSVTEDGNFNFCCDDLIKEWLLKEYSNISDLASIDKGTGTIIGGGPDE